MELVLQSLPLIAFPVVSVLLFAFLLSVSHRLSLHTSALCDSVLYHFLVPVKVYQNLVSSSLSLLLCELPEPSGPLTKDFLSLSVLIKDNS